MRAYLVYPMAAYVLYMFLLGLLVAYTRISSYLKKETPAKYYKLLQGETTERVLVVGRHYDNQFQLPILYLIACCAFLSVRMIDMTTVVLAWAFVASRLVHSFIHLTYNNPIHRLVAFFAGWVIVLVMFGKLVFLR